MVIWGVLGSQYVGLDLVRSDPIMTGMVSSMGQWLHSSVVAWHAGKTRRLAAVWALDVGAVRDRVTKHWVSLVLPCGPLGKRRQRFLYCCAPSLIASPQLKDKV